MVIVFLLLSDIQESKIFRGTNLLLALTFYSSTFYDLLIYSFIHIHGNTIYKVDVYSF